MRIKYKCKHCEKVFFRVKNGRSYIYCSNKCRGDSNITRIKTKCKICRTNIIVFPSRLSKQNFCSKICHGKFLSKFVREKSPMWNGGIMEHSDGYTYQLVGVKRYKGMHRIIMENHIGRKLKSKEIIHHINENKRDNRIGNLQIVSRAEHIRIHKPRLKLAK